MQLTTLLHQRHLKPLGFRKTGRNWVLPGLLAKVLNLQLSQWNSAEEARFTVNLGIFHPALHVALERDPLKSAPKPHECVINKRLGVLVHGHDYWWKSRLRMMPEPWRTAWLLI